jgi:hypothetical protein
MEGTRGLLQKSFSAYRDEETETFYEEFQIES